MKYATTGEKPPGTGTGSAFIHDPKHAGQREVKASVKLLFTTPGKAKVVVTRNLQAEQLKDSIRMKTLDSTIEITPANGGERRSQSAKCGEIDKQVPLLMGVSKPILELVIFCHQEDSNWPLTGTDAELKKNFDLIFSADRYQKALEEIKVQQKGLNARIKQLEPEVALWKERQDHIIKNDEELFVVKEQIKKAEADMQILMTQKTQLSSTMSIHADMIEKVRSCQMQLESTNAARKEIAARCHTCRLELDSELPDSDAALAKGQSEFDSRTAQLKKDLVEQKAQVEKLEAQHAMLLTRSSAAQSDASSLAGKLSALQDDSSKREKLLKALAKKWNFDATNPEAVKRVQANLEQQLQKAKTDLAQSKRPLEERVSECTAQVHVVQAERVSLSKQEAHTKQEIKGVEREIEAKKQLGDERVVISQKLEDAKAVLEKTKAKVGNLKDAEAELEELQQAKATLEKTIARRNADLTQASQRSRALEKATILRKAQKAKESELASVEAGCSKGLLRMLALKALPPILDLPAQLSSTITKLQGERDQIQREIEQMTAERVSLQSKRDMMQKEHSSLNERIRDLRTKLSEYVVGETTFAQAVDALHETLQEDRDALFSMEAKERLYAEFLVQSKEQSKCTLCKRGFADGHALDEFCSNLKEETGYEFQERLRTAKQRKVETEQVLDALKPAIPLEEELQRLLPQFERLAAELALVGPRITELDEQIEARRSQLQDVQRDLTDGHGLQSRVDTMVRLFRDNAKANEEAELAESVCGAGNAETMEQIQAELQLLQKKSTEHTKLIKDKRGALDASNKDVTAKERQVNELMDKLMKCESSKDSSMILSEKLKQLLESLASLQVLKTSADNNLKTATAAKDKAVEELDAFVSSESTKLTSLERELQDFRTDVVAATGSGSKDDIAAVQSQLAEATLLKKELDASLKDCSDRLKSSKMTLEATMKRINDAALERRNLDNNVKYRSAKRDLDECDSKIRKLKEDFEALGSTEVIAQREKDQKALDECSSKLSRLGGHRDTLAIQKKELETKIKSANPKNVAEELSNKTIELEAVRLSVKDLDVYHGALDQALMRYHEEKMAEINSVIRELWQTTYRGADIDTIQIQTDTEKTSAKSHKYRVVMVKGDSRLDMRGRCSAGQKVLASLVIRLALAESFGLNCGILALDEPTTNLDRENIESLAQGLGMILKHRRNHAGFQLLVITHDEEFVQMLGRADYADHFYLVTKNEDAFSTIVRKDIVELG